MGTGYIVSENGTLGFSKGCLVFHEAGFRLRFTMGSTPALVIIGPVSISTSAFRAIQDNHMNVLFLDGEGYVVGRVNFSIPNVHQLVHQQHLLEQDEHWKLMCARKFIQGRLALQMGVVDDCMTTHFDAARTEATKQALHGLVQRVNEATDVYEIEEIAEEAHALFRVARTECLHMQWESSDDPNSVNPDEAMEAVVRFLNTLLYYRIKRLLEEAGLDPSVGYLPMDCVGERLTLDFMFGYQLRVVTQLTCRAFNTSIVSREDCQRDGKGNVTLSQGAMWRLAQQFELLMHVQEDCSPGGVCGSFEAVIKDDVQAYRDYLACSCL